MADGSNGNPFLGTDEDLIEDELENPSTGKSPAIEHAEISWDFVAAKLLRDNFILTALELHTELVESGRELPRLRDYFSNPGNFERTKAAESSSPTLQRTSSVQTFDSLDFARYSDDGERQVDERMAVLEFELRKAHETIKGLRATLTKAAETELASPEQGDDGLSPHGKEDPIKPLEKRALDFLVNEYLLINNYKLTSVTFSEENGDQDFEDWDDVGLNIPKPPNLLHLFRDYGSHALTGKETSDSVCQIDLEFEDVALLQAAWDDIREKLESKVLELEIELLEVSKEKEELTTQINNSKWMSEDLSAALPGRIPVTEAASPVEQPADNSVGLSSEGFPDEETHTKESPGKDDLADSNVGETSELDDNSTIEANSSEVAVEKISSESEADERNVSAAFLQVLKEATLGSTKDHRIVTEVSRIVADFKTENVVLMLARCLPHIVPHVLLARREELIPLILCTTMLHPDVKERDRLLNILFNLIKKPDAEQRQMILRGCVAFAERVGPTRLEAELLPQCWEQISHKYVERRLLVAEACGVLAPYLPNTIRISLVLSMLQQMLHDDKEEEVREAAVKSLGLLFSLISDQDKYHQGSELLKTALNDSSQKVSTACQHMFLPSFALWALELNWLEHSLIHSLLQQLEHLVKSAIAVQKATNSGILPMNEAKFSLLVTALQQLVPFLFVSVLQSGPFASRVEDCLSSDTPFIDVSRFPKPSSDLTDVRTIVGDVQRLSAIVYLFEEHISQEWFEPWEQFNWVVNNLIPRLQEIIIGVGLSSQLISMLCRYFFRLCRTFGRVFVDKKIKPKFKELLVVPDDESENHFVAGETALMSCIVPVYAAGVLSSFHMEEDKKQLSQFLQDVLCTLALRQAPLNSLQAAFRELCITKEAAVLKLITLQQQSWSVQPSIPIPFQILLSRKELHLTGRQ